jgi:hypothetical protein
MKSLVKYLDCGISLKSLPRDAIKFVVTKTSDVTQKILPLFDLYKGLKQPIMLISKKENSPRGF